ncbi:DEHA2E21340p [Debaryomyces hansenii CBS767]|uniref:RNA helicase n=1 Tax=Debaryomyces hansenii (strain ATCC 36239 / CBS 767 / BCRC 21394 / JCM 1990 / NBRC 0083 / IGC 2968) TaxID=284592 RepID=B5RU49_DEBHA|nr:DEHA2E21340p [Debaryomyces hansenii CBS767]CAR65861.1 DEHA2E21340p [Debaryomyces hansenii CBS767]|eukprot:XP_002770519.1 DEHA2E21340p [Debaryomyces hansenii CBS767]
MSNTASDLSKVLEGSNHSKKRKRRRNNKGKSTTQNSPTAASSTETNELPTENDNKKIKFDDDSGNNGDILNIRDNGSSVKLTGTDDDKLIDANLSDETEEKIIKPKKSIEQSTTDPRKAKKMKKVVNYEDSEEDEDEGNNSYYKSKDLSNSQLSKKASDLYEVRQKLPIFQHKDEILRYVNKNQVTVIIGETGSGKSTQIPQFLMPTNRKQIAVTQPRRVAAASLAARVSEEYGCRLGQEVGYQVRFSNVTHPHKTKLKYLTDGMLLREIMLDGNLNKYSTIIIDEAHERTILTDLIMGFLKELIVSKKRADLKIIIMSATLNAELFSKFFDQAPILFVEGKMYPVSKHYLADSTEDIADTMVRSIVQVNMSEQEGDILCFLPGQEEIDSCVNILQQVAPQLPREAPLIVALPLYAALSPAQQSKIFEKLPGRKRKVILATNIAETSITVSGVKYVIDSGLRKVKVWKHQLGLSTLLTTPISQASAKQRAGRAGRESPGKVFRLYSEKTFFNQLPKQQESEIMRNDIVLPILTLKKIGVDDLLNWTWLEHPGQEAILSALTTLYSLGALDDSGKITKLGYKMSVLPLPPQLSVVLLSALDFGVLSSVIDIVACISVDNLILNVGSGNGEIRDEINFKRRNYCPLGCKQGDLIAVKEFFSYYKELIDNGNTSEAKAWCKELHFSYKGFKNVMRVRNQLKDYMMATVRQDDTLKQHERDQQLRNIKLQLDAESLLDDDSDADTGVSKQPLDIPAILKSFLKGYITNTAIGMPDRSYRTCTTGQLISIHPSSTLFGKANLDAIMYIEYVYTAKGYGRNCSVIELGWLQEIAPQLLGASKISINE